MSPWVMMPKVRKRGNERQFPIAYGTPVHTEGYHMKFTLSKCGEKVVI
jgi:hypothetical protein